jgi:hypothetical protein
MVAFILGCFYLINALIYIWLLKDGFNVLGFIYNSKNRNFLLLYDLPFIALAVLAMIEQMHWLFFILFLMHSLNSVTLLLKPSLFYQTKNDIQNLDETTLVNYMVMMSVVAGLGCLFLSYL